VAERKYSGVTPKRPDAICLMREFLLLLRRSGASPPSPELLIPPILFIASPKASCASGEMEPKLIAAVEKRLKIASLDSTLSSAIGSRSDLSSKKSLIILSPRLFTNFVNS